MVPQGGKLQSFSCVRIHSGCCRAFEQAAERFRLLSVRCDLCADSDLFHEWEEKHLRGNIRSLITSEGPRLGALIKWLQILFMSGILKCMFYPQGWDHAESTDFCLNLGHKRLLAFKRTFASNVLAAASARVCPPFSCGKPAYDPDPSCLIRDNLLEFPLSTP